MSCTPTSDDDPPCAAHLALGARLSITSSNAGDWLRCRTKGKEENGGGKLKLGICSMERKTKGDSMTQILHRLFGSEKIENSFEKIHFTDEMLAQSEEEWPRTDVLVCFHTHKFPIPKAVRYVERVRPWCVNDVFMQHALLSRVFVYRTLRAAGVPCPDFQVIDHAKLGEDERVVEEEDWIEFRGNRIKKPFVEKPRSAEDHDIRIYYPQSQYLYGRRVIL